MHRRLPTALVLFAALLGAVAHAADAPALPSITSVTLSGGFSIRDTISRAGVNQGRTTQIQGISPTTLRLRADWYPLRFFGLEGEGLGDFFTAVKQDQQHLAQPSARGAVRLGVALRFFSPSGFVLSGSLGYGASWSPYIYLDSPTSTNPIPRTLFSQGPMARVSIGYQGARFEGVATAAALFGLSASVHSLEPQLWLAGRVADLGPTALWVGLDAGLLLESSPQYAGPTFRFALGVKLSLLPPAPPPRPLVEGLVGETSLELQVVLPDGAPAIGAMVAVDDAAPAPVNAEGTLTVTPAKSGSHSASAKLSGYRSRSGSAEVVEGKKTAFVLRLEALTGPGTLSGVVRASATGSVVPDALVTAGEMPPVRAGPDGTYRIENIGPGPVKVRFEAQGFTVAEEIAQVPPESVATLDVQLEALGKGSPATVRGLVRSRTGEALKASVVIKGLATKVQVTAEGRFFVTVPGGTYQFVISAPGYVTQTKKVVLADGDQAIVHTELQKVSK